MCDRGNCGKTFDSNTDLKRHQNLHDNNLQKCYFCPWRSPAFKNDAILTHFDQHLDNPRFSCPVCGKKFFIKYDMQKHFENSHEKVEGKYKCRLCDFRGHSRVHVSNHMKSHK